MVDPHVRIKVLEAKNEQLQNQLEIAKEEIRILKSTVIGKPILIPIEWLLTSKEEELLTLLYNKNGKVVSKEHLQQVMYSLNSEVQIKIVDVFVCKVRKKLKDLGFPGAIETHWGKGYSMSQDFFIYLDNIVNSKEKQNDLPT